MRDALVLIHAGAGVAGLLVGFGLITPPLSADEHRGRRMVFLALLVIVLASLLGMIVLDWDGIDLAARLTFTGLGGLASVMAYRMWSAHSLAGRRPVNWEESYVDHTYFSYISLWVGFAIVPALQSNNPGLWIPIAVVAVLATGTVAIKRYKAHLGLSS